MATFTIDELKEMALAANAARDWKSLQTVIEILDDLWLDDRAAMAFYTRLEQESADEYRQATEDDRAAQEQAEYDCEH